LLGLAVGNALRDETWLKTTLDIKADDGTIDQIVSTPGHKYFLPFNTESREVGEVHEHANYAELSVKWVSACNLKIGDRVLLAAENPLTGKPKYGIVIGVKTEQLDEPMAVYNFEVRDFHTYYVGKNSVCTHNAACDLTPREMNNLQKDILSGKDVHLKTEAHARQLIDTKFSNFPQETAGLRSAQGWHYDAHSLVRGGPIVEHINIYSKTPYFRVHITWG